MIDSQARKATYEYRDSY